MNPNRNKANKLTAEFSLITYVFNMDKFENTATVLNLFRTHRYIS